ncbi:MAG: pyruvate formate lyase family protein [Kiritimatiellia bacterium]
MKRREFLKAAAFAAMWTAGQRCFGWSLTTDPLGGAGLDEGSGLARAELEKMFDAIAAAHAKEPFIVTRTRWLAALFDHVRLAANADNAFVHWFADCDLPGRRCWLRLKAFSESAPERKLCGKWTTATNGAWRARLDTSHTCPDWESILALGPKGLADRARKRRETAKTDDERLFLDCVAEVYDALSRLCVRWAAVAEKRGMPACAESLRAIAERPPRTLREALQLSLVYDRGQEAEGECVRSQGLFDRLYVTFYRNDLAAGRETRASAKALIADYFTRLYAQGHPNGKNIGFGGYDAEGVPVWNELTELAFELHDELNRPNPKLTYRFGKKTPREQLEKVTRCLANGRTSIVFANEEVLGEMFRRRGKAAEDIVQYVLVGCYEPGIQGREIVASMAAEVNLAKPLEAVFNSGKDFAGFPVGPACALPENAEAFEREYLRQLDAMITSAVETARLCERSWYDLNPAPFMSGGYRDCIEKAKDSSQGGCRYNQSGIMCGGIGTVADSLAAVRALVDEKKLVTMAELGEILRTDWKDREELRLRAVRAAPKWGNNDDRADLPAKRVYDAVAARINAEPNGHGGTFQAGFWSIDLDKPFGDCTAATPDGRKAKTPISRNNSATAGCGKEGPTALLLSNAKLDLAESADGHIADVILPAALAKASFGAAGIAAFLRSYFEMGGQSIHLNCFDPSTLRDAMAHPENYPDLQVRVCGWNVRWNDLSRREQLLFLATAEAQSSH